MLVLYVKGFFKRKRLQQYCLCVPKRGVCNDDTYVLCSDVPVAQTCKQNAAFFSTDSFKAKIYIFFLSRSIPVCQPFVELQTDLGL